VQQAGGCSGAAIGGRLIFPQQIAHKDQIFRETLVREKIELQIQIRGHGAGLNHFAEIRFEFGSGEDSRHLLRERSVGALLARAQIPARKPVVPGFIGKFGNGAAIDILHVSADIVLLKESGETRV